MCRLALPQCAPADHNASRDLSAGREMKGRWMGTAKRFRTRVALACLAMATTAVVAIPATSGAAATNATPRIVGGKPVPKGDLPALAALLVPGKGKATFRLVCSGTLVAPDVILSAAHCVEPIFFGFGLEGQTGSRDLGDKSAATSLIQSVVVNKTWFNGSQSDDLALFKLSAPASTALSTLASKSDRALTTNLSPVQIAGWGLTIQLPVFGDPGSAVPPRRAQQATVPIVGDDICQADYADLDPTEFVPPTDLCAGAEGKDACYGDSGGPMYATDPSGTQKQIGVVSRGAGCATKSYPGIYTDLTVLRPWIDKNIANPCKKALDGLPIDVFVC
jgi:secreted trypsin-like serine protease